MKYRYRGRIAAFLLLSVLLSMTLGPVSSVAAADVEASDQAVSQPRTGTSPRLAAADPALLASPLSVAWPASIRRWGSLIGPMSLQAGLDPDFVAAVVNEESNGIPDGISRVGAVGLMGVMPSGPGLEWRPTTDELLEPAVNLDWGINILADIVRQSGGDVFAALAAYSGGWDQAGKRVPRAYAASVLDNYARAVLVRRGLDPSFALRWTIAVEIRRGNIPSEPLLMGVEPLSELQTYAKHLVYHYVDAAGRAFHVTGYAVPLAIVEPPRLAEPAGTYALLDPLLMARQGLLTIAKRDEQSARVVVACLPSISRLRGYASTRWYAPSDCPDWHR